jgi:hypothetical protein
MSMDIGSYLIMRKWNWSKKRDIPLADLIQNGIVDAPASSIDSFDGFQAIRRQQKTLNI